MTLAKKEVQALIEENGVLKIMLLDVLTLINAINSKESRKKPLHAKFDKTNEITMIVNFGWKISLVF